jgi:hypothetical protein
MVSLRCFSYSAYKTIKFYTRQQALFDIFQAIGSLFDPVSRDASGELQTKLFCKIIDCDEGMHTLHTLLAYP